MVSGFSHTAFGAGWFQDRASEHMDNATRGECTGGKLPGDHELNRGHQGGCDIIVNCWMVLGRSDGRWVMDMTGI